MTVSAHGCKGPFSREATFWTTWAQAQVEQCVFLRVCLLGVVGQRRQNDNTDKIAVWKGTRESLGSQQFTCGVVSEGVSTESLRKFCGKFAEKNQVLLQQEISIPSQMTP